MSAQTITSCEEALRLLEAYLDHELTDAGHEAMEHHLRRCRSCCSRAEFEQHMKAELAQLRRADLRPAFEQRIRELIAQFAAPGEPGPE
jgi:hypothetical protein